MKGCAKVQKLRQQSFQMSGTRLWNCLAKGVSNLKRNNLDESKQMLGEYLCKVPDEPKCDGLNAGATNLVSGGPTNWIIYQVAMRKEAWVSKADTPLFIGVNKVLTIVLFHVCPKRTPRILMKYETNMLSAHRKNATRNTKHL